MAELLRLKNVKISRLLEIDKEQNFSFGFEVLAGDQGLDRSIENPEVNRPGLSLSGFYDHFAFNRIQVFGKGEISYINKLLKENDTENLIKFFDYEIPVCIITYGSDVPAYVLEIANSKNVPILRTHLSSEKLISLINTILSDLFAAYTIFHGNLVSIYNIGVLVIGTSGIGKSESILGLVERGHKFIADDMVKIKKLRTPSGFRLMGQPNISYGPYLEIRGIGIINVAQYYGEGRVLNTEQLGLIIKLLEWNSSYSYDRLGMDEKYMDILGINVPVKEIPVSGGRNIPLLIEVAAYREIMRRLGYNSAEELDKKIIQFMKNDKEVV